LILTRAPLRAGKLSHPRVMRGHSSIQRPPSLGVWSGPSETVEPITGNGVLFLTITILNQLLAHNQARTEALSRRSKKPVLAHIGSKRTAHFTAHIPGTGPGCFGENYFAGAGGRSALPPCGALSSRLSRSLHHLHENLSGLGRVAHFPRESNSDSTYAIVGFQPHMEAEAVH